MSNTGNLTPMDKSTFRWFRWIHRTNISSLRERFFRWRINDVMTHGRQILVKSDCSMDPKDSFKTSYYIMDTLYYIIMDI